LDRIRASLRATRPFLEAEAARAPHAPPPFVHPITHDDLVQQFAAELTKLQAYPHLCADDEAALETIASILAQHEAREVITWDLEKIDLPGLADLLRQRGVRRLDGRIAGEPWQRAASLQAHERAPVCIAGVDVAIAESATLVVHSGEGRARMASLLAPVFIAVVRQAQFVRGLGEAVERIKQKYGDVFRDASALTLITGPSRTADIELTLTLGVHGPREVHVVIIE
ncbi:MAG: lactate utilization protein, partial [Roseiflexaceae bacterium]|nr:lactate utilization protein [Roseiflexaceae bacterium]